MQTIAFFRDTFRAFRKNTRAAIAVEMAFVLPIFIMLGFLSWDAATIYTQIKRGTKHYYSVGDVMASQTRDMTCSRLDKVAELVYSSYAAGNWARRPRPTGNDFTRDGALDFRYVIRVVTVQDPATETVTGDLRGRVRWEYFRTPEDMDTESEVKPGELIDIPDGLRIAGQTYVQIAGRLWVAPAINYLGVFDFNPADNTVTHTQFDVVRFFPLRYVTSLGLDSSASDPMTDKCSDGSNYGL
ncbi:TadE/TadG family type IV pilus assembly protein [Oricola nitratireducens]|jgi:hypothetical protein|uniref:TadE/TadG family type IV pilus assembly protein n=1 Tax=Oricola nitratireducens TaxID=2775868 RepID=UPI001867CF6B|nr:hypothetical protein [Oricola nitratireducens]